MSTERNDAVLLDAIQDTADALAPEGSIICSGIVYFRILDVEGNSTFVWKECVGVDGPRPDISLVVGDLHRIAHTLMDQNYMIEDGTQLGPDGGVTE